jgi:outer membrane protein TolC
MRSQKGNYAPKVSLVAGVDYLNQDDLGFVDQDEHNAFVGITAQWDLFTGGQRPAKVREIESEIRKLKDQRQEKILSIQSSIRQALDVAQTAYLTYQRQEKALELTKRIREHVEKTYKAGTAPLTRLNEAQTDLVRAAGQFESSRIQYQLALVNLKTETGQILESR